MTQAQAPNKKLPNAEQLLQGFTAQLENRAAGWRAVVVNLSRLRPDGNRARQFRMVASAFQHPVQQCEGRIFLMQNGDIAVVCKDTDRAAVDGAVAKARLLFGDDPLTSQFEELLTDGFATAYDLGSDYAKFAAYVQHMSNEEARRQKRQAPGGATQTDLRQPLDPQSLAELVAVIARADLSAVIRRQPICDIAGGEPPKPIYREIYVAIESLRDTYMPRRDIAADRWLFQYLTQTLDRRVLALLRSGNEESASAHSCSLNLNVATVLSPDFHAFDQSLRPGTRGSIIIELEKADVFNDLGAFSFARDFVRERGYRVCLDGVTALSLPFIDRERLGLDLVKMFWTMELATDQRGERVAEMRGAIERIGRSRVILARCSEPGAIQFGLDCGLHLFQGREVDRLLAGRGNVARGGSAAAPQAAAAAR